MTARDGDRSLDAPVSYLIDPGEGDTIVFEYIAMVIIHCIIVDTNPGSAFIIISSTGVITVNNKLDRETIPLYNLRVGVSIILLLVVLFFLPFYPLLEIRNQIHIKQCFLRCVGQVNNS